MSRHIPIAVDQKVRKASGFRCAWCGNYLTERHHIYPFSVGGPHSEDNLILLCPNCHAQLGTGKISMDELKNRRIGLTGKLDRSSGCLSINKQYFQIDVGSNHFINCQNILMLNDIPLISVRNDNGYLLLSLRLFSKSGHLVCWMSENRWWVDNETIMNFQHSKDRFSITDADNLKILDLALYEKRVEISGLIYLLGDAIELSKNEMKFRNSQNRIIGCTFQGPNGIVIKENSFAKPIGGCGVLIGV